MSFSTNDIFNSGGPGSSAEPSMEEILASIRRILKEEDTVKAAPVDLDDDVLVLDQSMLARPADVASVTYMPLEPPPPEPPALALQSSPEPLHFSSEPTPFAEDFIPAPETPPASAYDPVIPLQPPAAPSLATYEPLISAPPMQAAPVQAAPAYQPAVAEPPAPRPAPPSLPTYEPLISAPPMQAAPMQAAPAYQPAVADPPALRPAAPSPSTYEPLISAPPMPAAPMQAAPVYQPAIADPPAALPDAVVQAAPAYQPASADAPAPPAVSYEPLISAPPMQAAPSQAAPSQAAPVQAAPASYSPPPPPMRPEPPRLEAKMSEKAQENVEPPHSIISEKTTDAAASSIGALVRSISMEKSVAVSRHGVTIEDMVREEIRPLLKAWLDTHLPSLVERVVRTEIERVIDRSGT